MQVWSEASKNSSRVLREAGKQMLVASEGSSTLDLSGQPGVFRVNTVNTQTGEVTRGETVEGGKPVKLPDAPVVWLVKE